MERGGQKFGWRVEGGGRRAEGGGRRAEGGGRRNFARNGRIPHLSRKKIGAFVDHLGKGHTVVLLSQGAGSR